MLVQEPLWLLAGYNKVVIIVVVIVIIVNVINIVIIIIIVLKIKNLAYQVTTPLIFYAWRPRLNFKSGKMMQTRSTSV